ncbi:PEP-CTERM sorting domain-containing protein [Aquabacterium sp. J223]|uniref:PEP-CTERM sorting domain-containing protein n=1 Tax=Aquabacterium sp. J223 TaxID=2898431 RepID=UPI0021AD5688|nr:PEP-CTERM sorting domain-containing protein [Aquabacterium sp. J223]UUX96911.1 PEP-CTERM sorting domain-containing protein [Aquabacterium sp. J223]
MKLHSIVAAALLACGAAHATVVVNTVGPVTTYFEDFNGGSSFTGGALIPDSGDDYLLVIDVPPLFVAPLATYTFNASTPLSSLELSFWYSVPGDLSGAVALVSIGTAVLPDTPGDAFSFLVNNPGPAGNGDDAFINATLTLLPAGDYTLAFASAPGAAVKIDDVTIITTAIPEPETYALLLGGLGVMGLAARRRQGR